MLWALARSKEYHPCSFLASSLTTACISTQTSFAYREELSIHPACLEFDPPYISLKATCC